MFDLATHRQVTRAAKRSRVSMRVSLSLCERICHDVRRIADSVTATRRCPGPSCASAAHAAEVSQAGDVARLHADDLRELGQPCAVEGEQEGEVIVALFLEGRAVLLEPAPDSGLIDDWVSRATLYLSIDLSVCLSILSIYHFDLSTNLSTIHPPTPIYPAPAQQHPHRGHPRHVLCLRL